MVLHFFSRRSYDKSRKKFNNNRAVVTRYICLDDVREIISTADMMTAADWAADVLASANGHPILCFVHGFNMVQPEVLERLKKIQGKLSVAGFKGAVIAFDWPSKGAEKHYVTDRTTAQKMAPFLIAEGLGHFMNAKPRPDLHILAHSMGVHLTLRGFSTVGDAGTTPWRVDQVAFCAADTEDRFLARGTGFAKVMRDRASRVTNYYSNRDQVLALSSNLPGNGPRLGFSGAPELKEDEHVDVYCGTRYDTSIPKPPPGGIGPDRHTHTWYFDDDPGFITDLKATLDGVPSGKMGKTRGVIPGTGDQALL